MVVRHTEVCQVLANFGLFPDRRLLDRDAGFPLITGSNRSDFSGSIFERLAGSRPFLDSALRLRTMGTRAYASDVIDQNHLERTAMAQ
jgi:hypothetical protein